MTTSNPTPEQNLPAGSNSEETRADSADETSTQKATGFFSRVQQVLSEPEPMHPSEEKEIVVDMTPVKETPVEED